MSYQQSVQSTTPVVEYREEANAWAMGFITLAATLMMIGGIFWVVQGIAVLVDDNFFVVGSGYAFELDLTAWGWVHLIGGAVLTLAGIFLFTGNILARIVGIAVAALAAIANFVFIPYYPIWSILIIAVCIGVIWAIVAHGHDAAEI
jgi:hypothetical protein